MRKRNCLQRWERKTAYKDEKEKQLTKMGKVHTRRRINTEEKAKVIAAVWGQNLYNSLPREVFSGLGICSFAHHSFAHLLICSFCSNQMSDFERFAQIAQDKWATVSESLRSLKGNEQLWANRSGHSRQMSDPERFAQVAQRKWANERFDKKKLVKKI